MMKPEKSEIATELVEFLNSTGQYQNFLDWEEERGYVREEVEAVLDKIEEDN